MKKITPHPSPSKIVMTAMLETGRDAGSSLDDIVKFAVSRYGLREARLRTRIEAALKRGVKYNILQKDRGLYWINWRVCRMPSVAKSTKSRMTSRESVQVEAVIRRNGAAKTSTPAPRPNGRRRPALKNLCPECLEAMKSAAATVGNGEASGTGAAIGDVGKEPLDAETTKDEEHQEDTTEEAPKVRKGMAWKDFLGMRLSFRGRRRNKEKK